MKIRLIDFAGCRNELDGTVTNFPEMQITEDGWEGGVAFYECQ